MYFVVEYKETMFEKEPFVRVVHGCESGFVLAYGKFHEAKAVMDSLIKASPKSRFAVANFGRLYTGYVTIVDADTGDQS
jgi:hypothetical protein